MAEARLEYAPRPAVLRRRVVRRGVLAVLILVVAGVGWWGGGAIGARVGLMYWQRECLTFSLPGDRVVYEEKVTGAEVLPGPGVSVIAKNRPACWGKYIGAGWTPGTFASGEAIVFLHGMRSRAGVERLVVVEKGLECTQPLYAPFELRPTVIAPAGWRGMPAVMTPMANRLGEIDIAQSILKPVRVRMYAGQSDPGDAAHFTIRYEMDNEVGGRGAGTIDGRLSDDGSHVTMTVRDGPARPPSRWGTPTIPDP